MSNEEVLPVIRNAQKEDLSFLEHGLYQVRKIEKRPEPDLPVNEEDRRSFLKGIREGIIRVIDGPEGEPVAFLYYRTDHPVMYVSGYIFWIDLVYVEEGYRGQGLGKLLYRDAARIAVELGLGKMVIDIFEPNSRSRRFHAGLGFNPFYTIYTRDL